MDIVLEPRQHVTDCPSCGGMGGFARGETAFDCCSTCAGSGKRSRYECRVPLIDQECGERVLMVVYRSDTRVTVWGCINGHRWDKSVSAGAVTWARKDDRAAAVVEAVAS